MSRTVAVALILTFFLAAGARAGEASGVHQSIDVNRATVTIRVDGKDRTYKVDKSARYYDDGGRELKGGLTTAKDVFKEGQKVTFSTELRMGQEWVLEVRAKK